MRLLFPVHEWSNSGKFIWFNLIEAAEVGNVSVLKIKGEGIWGVIFKVSGQIHLKSVFTHHLLRARNGRQWVWTGQTEFGVIVGHLGVAVYEEVKDLKEHWFLPVATRNSSAIFILPWT